MKKLLKILLVCSIMLSSCATILMGPVSDCQRTRPLVGQPQREIRGGILILDVLCFGIPLTLIDFATGAIYKPCDSNSVKEIKTETAKQRYYRELYGDTTILK